MITASWYNGFYGRYINKFERFGVRIIAPPTGEQYTLADAKLHLRVDDDGSSPPSHPDDVMIEQMLIPASRQYCEGYTGLSLATQTLELGGRSFPNVYWQACGCGYGESMAWDNYIELPYGPVQSVLAVTYFDADGNEQTMPTSDYELDNYQTPPRLYANGAGWPSTRGSPTSARVRYIAGYDLPGTSPTIYPIPQLIVAAMKLILGGLYDNRSEDLILSRTETLAGDVTLTAERLLDRYRIDWGTA